MQLGMFGSLFVVILDLLCNNFSRKLFSIAKRIIFIFQYCLENFVKCLCLFIYSTCFNIFDKISWVNVRCTELFHESQAVFTRAHDSPSKSRLRTIVLVSFYILQKNVLVKTVL